MAFIVKIQRSLVAYQDGKPAPQQILVYNEPRTVKFEGDITPDIEKLFPPGCHKIYAKAKQDGRGALTILGTVKAQPW